MRFLALAAVLVPLAASAQVTISADVGSGSPPQVYIGRANCKTQLINFTWDVGTGNPTLGQEIDIIKARSSGTCSSTTVTDPDKDTVAASQAETGTDQVKASDMILDQSDAGLAGGCDNTDRSSANPYTTHYCIQLKPTSGLGGTPVFGDIPVNFAMANPTPPTGVVLAPGDQHLKVSWTAGNAGEKISSYDVHVLLPDAGLDPARHADRVSAATSTDVNTTDDGTTLQNDVTYSVSVVANDAYSNVSDPSAAATGAPKAILDFYALYRTEGGGAGGGGGCSSTGAATWIAALALAVGILSRRRRKARSGALLVAGLSLLAPAARADWVAPERPARRVLVGLKIDRYDPKVDSEAGLTGQPYHEIFGGRAPLRWQLEVDWEIAHPFGSLLAGVTLGYWQNIGKGVLASDITQKSQDTALLDVMPFGLIATWRFDWLADRWSRFPLIPYAQAGLQRALWASFSGTGAVSRDTARGGRGSGWSYGYTTALGVALNLDAIDPELAREAYVDTGIQRTSAFAEYGWTRLDNFHQTGGLILTDRAWRFGLSMEF